MSTEFIVKKATKKSKHLRISFSAQSGGGKTLSALRAAFGITKDWNKICVIDSEKDSACLYADDERFNIGQFNTISLRKPYSPERYIAAMRAAIKDHDVVILDSITHEWAGAGGCLEIHNQLGGSFRDWAVVTPLHNAFIDAILEAPCHMFCTVRRKEDYAMNRDGAGKMKIEKVGLKEVTREGFTYEMDLVFSIADNHMAIATKDRTGLFDGKDPIILDESIGEQLVAWADKGRSNLDDAMSALRAVKSRKELLAVHSTYKADVGKHEDYKEAISLKSKEYPKEDT